LFCFSDGNINGVVAPMGAVPESNIRDTLTANGWRIDFLGPTTYLATTAGFVGDVDELPEALRTQMGEEAVKRMRDIGDRFKTISGLIDGDRVHLPFNVVHAHRVD
jgi:hypothetical protein